MNSTFKSEKTYLELNDDIEVSEEELFDLNNTILESILGDEDDGSN